MSGQAKRSRILAAQRKRRRVAVELVNVIDWRGRVPVAGTIDGYRYTARVEAVIAGDAFEGFIDVRRARAHAESLVGLDDEHAAFTDWTMDQGLGPDNREPGAFTNRGCIGPGVDICPGCMYCPRGGWPGKLAREWPGDRRAPMGRRLAQLGRDILAAIEGQPSECQHWTANDGKTMRTVIIDHVPTVIPCGCRGTGHNLHGTLPAIEWSAQVRREMSDVVDACGNEWHRVSRWQFGVIVELRSRSRSAGGLRYCWRVLALPNGSPSAEHLHDLDDGGVCTTQTRVVQRGVHTSMGHNPEVASDLCRGWAPYASPDTVTIVTHNASGTPIHSTYLRHLTPAWERGNAKHHARETAR